MNNSLINQQDRSQATQRLTAIGGRKPSACPPGGTRGEGEIQHDRRTVLADTTSRLRHQRRSNAKSLKRPAHISLTGKPLVAMSRWRADHSNPFLVIISPRPVPARPVLRMLSWRRFSGRCRKMLTSAIDPGIDVIDEARCRRDPPCNWRRA